SEKQNHRSTPAIVRLMFAVVDPTNRPSVAATKENNMKSPYTYQRQNLSAWFRMPALLAILSCFTVSATLAQEDSNPGIVPISNKVFGKTYGQWAAAWQQWAFGIPAAQSPFLDETGAF